MHSKTSTGYENWHAVYRNINSLMQTACVPFAVFAYFETCTEYANWEKNADKPLSIMQHIIHITVLLRLHLLQFIINKKEKKW